MSQESTQWLNTNTLIGFTAKRGQAWHYDADLQGPESNHYEDAVPTEDVIRRLFNWQAIEGEISATAITTDGVLVTKDTERKAIMRSDTGAVLGVFKQGYSVHQYEEWLLRNVSDLLDDGLSIGSAGLLRGGAVAWVSVELPDNIETPEGVAFRPNLVAYTSHDGTLASGYKRTITVVVCDNTLASALGGAGEVFRVKHSRYSAMRLQDARDALGIVHTMADDFAQQVEALCATTVTDKQWSQFLDSLVPIPEDEGSARTRAENKRGQLNNLWRNDPRVSPWQGSAFGVLQAVNTYEHHLAQVRRVERGERNRLRAIRGEFDALDATTMQQLEAVLV